jgi:hypothetical protein
MALHASTPGHATHSSVDLLQYNTAHIMFIELGGVILLLWWRSLQPRTPRSYKGCPVMCVLMRIVWRVSWQARTDAACNKSTHACTPVLALHNTRMKENRVVRVPARRPLQQARACRACAGNTHVLTHVGCGMHVFGRHSWTSTPMPQHLAAQQRMMLL